MAIRDQTQSHNLPFPNPRIRSPPPRSSFRPPSSLSRTPSPNRRIFDRDRDRGRPDWGEYNRTFAERDRASRSVRESWSVRRDEPRSERIPQRGFRPSQHTPPRGPRSLHAPSPPPYLGTNIPGPRSSLPRDERIPPWEERSQNRDRPRDFRDPDRPLLLRQHSANSSPEGKPLRYPRYRRGSSSPADTKKLPTSNGPVKGLELKLGNESVNQNDLEEGEVVSPVKGERGRWHDDRSPTIPSGPRSERWQPPRRDIRRIQQPPLRSPTTSSTGTRRVASSGEPERDGLYRPSPPRRPRAMSARPSTPPITPTDPLPRLRPQPPDQPFVATNRTLESSLTKPHQIGKPDDPERRPGTPTLPSQSSKQVTPSRGLSIRVPPRDHRRASSVPLSAGSRPATPLYPPPENSTSRPTTPTHYVVQSQSLPSSIIPTTGPVLPAGVLKVESSDVAVGDIERERHSGDMDPPLVEEVVKEMFIVEMANTSITNVKPADQVTVTELISQAEQINETRQDVRMTPPRELDISSLAPSVIDVRHDILVSDLRPLDESVSRQSVTFETTPAGAEHPSPDQSRDSSPNVPATISVTTTEGLDQATQNVALVPLSRFQSVSPARKTIAERRAVKLPPTPTPLSSPFAGRVSKDSFPTADSIQTNTDAGTEPATTGLDDAGKIPQDEIINEHSTGVLDQSSTTSHLLAAVEKLPSSEPAIDSILGWNTAAAPLGPLVRVKDPCDWIIQEDPVDAPQLPSVVRFLLGEEMSATLQLSKQTAEYLRLYDKWKKIWQKLESLMEERGPAPSDLYDYPLPEDEEIQPLAPLTTPLAEEVSRGRGGRGLRGEYINSEAQLNAVLMMSAEEVANDPEERARHAAAIIPDMLSPPRYRYDDTNDLVEDPLAFYDFSDTRAPVWTHAERETFRKKFISNSQAGNAKNFGKIAEAIPNKTPNECVVFYYSTKKEVDYKRLRVGGAKRVVEAKKSAKSLLGDINASNQKEKAKASSAQTKNVGTPVKRPGTPAGRPMSSTMEMTPVDKPTTGVTGSGMGEKKTRAAPKRRRVSQTPDTRVLTTPVETPTGEEPGSPARRSGKKRRTTLVNPLPQNVEVQDVTKDEETPIASSVTSQNTEKPKRTTTNSYWSVEEKKRLEELVAIHGPDSRIVAAGLTGKSEKQVSNFLRAMNKKQGKISSLNGQTPPMSTIPLAPTKPTGPTSVTPLPPISSHTSIQGIQRDGMNKSDQRGRSIYDIYPTTQPRMGIFPRPPSHPLTQTSNPTHSTAPNGQSNIPISTERTPLMSSTPTILESPIRAVSRPGGMNIANLLNDSPPPSSKKNGDDESDTTDDDLPVLPRPDLSRYRSQPLGYWGGYTQSGQGGSTGFPSSVQGGQEGLIGQGRDYNKSQTIQHPHPPPSWERQGLAGIQQGRSSSFQGNGERSSMNEWSYGRQRPSIQAQLESQLLPYTRNQSSQPSSRPSPLLVASQSPQLPRQSLPSIHTQPLVKPVAPERPQNRFDEAIQSRPPPELGRPSIAPAEETQ
ncbi:hypothetical protein M231_04155 [Tremella mesenterica]|uniref:SANT domain-containing protein n=1 Tax=Tremella mesenterica TaxID=5217 RepID=A0A4Q1BL67_TREME|nr:hypothetical protein M231_04155 [Tremella mesenterica]